MKYTLGNIFDQKFWDLLYYRENKQYDIVDSTC